jgi:hypothetical protein
MLGLFVSDELEKIWKEAAAQPKYWPGVCLENLRKAMKTLQIAQCPSQDSNWISPEYKSITLYGLLSPRNITGL